MAKVRKSLAKDVLKKSPSKKNPLNKKPLEKNSLENAQRTSKKKKTERNHDGGVGQIKKSKSAPQVGGGNARQLSDGEINILAVFKKYLMAPGQMLCLSNTDIGSMKTSLEKLTEAGLLVPEDFKGSYSLTRSGFDAMNELDHQ